MPLVVPDHEYLTFKVPQALPIPAWDHFFTASSKIQATSWWIWSHAPHRPFQQIYIFSNILLTMLRTKQG